jgi:RNA polymerase sigma factor (sigma-70 family)
VVTPPDDGPLEALVRQYGRLVAAVVGRIAGPRADAIQGDVEQQVYLGLWRQVRAEQTIERPASYVYRAAVRETLRALRRERERDEEPLQADGPEPAAPEREDPERRRQANELAREIERCLAGLASEREAAVRAHLGGFGVSEIMAMHGWPYQKARNLVARGIADLRGCLRGKGLHE